jgi:hypothetical protein
MKLTKIVPLVCLLFALAINGQEAFASSAKSTVGITFEGTTSTTTSDSEKDMSPSGKENSGNSATDKGILPNNGEAKQQLSFFGLILVLLSLMIGILRRKGREL